MSFINNYFIHGKLSSEAESLQEFRQTVNERSIDEIRMLSRNLAAFKDHPMQEILLSELELFKGIKLLQDSKSLGPVIQSIQKEDLSGFIAALSKLIFGTFSTLLPVLTTYLAFKNQAEMIAHILRSDQLTLKQVDELFQYAKVHKLHGLQQMMEQYYVPEEKMTATQKIELFAIRSDRADLQELLDRVDLAKPSQRELKDLFSFAKTHQLSRLTALLEAAYPDEPSQEPPSYFKMGLGIIGTVVVASALYYGFSTKRG